jgi:hypothetical protein
MGRTYALRNQRDRHVGTEWFSSARTGFADAGAETRAALSGIMGDCLAMTREGSAGRGLASGESAELDVEVLLLLDRCNALVKGWEYFAAVGTLGWLVHRVTEARGGDPTSLLAVFADVREHFDRIEQLFLEDHATFGLGWLTICDSGAGVALGLAVSAPRKSRLQHRIIEMINERSVVTFTTSELRRVSEDG